MTYRDATLRVFSIIILSMCLTQNVNAMTTKWLLALAGDACIAASLCSLAVKNMSIEERIRFRIQAPPSVYSQICTDAHSISPYFSLMIPVGLILSSGSRIGMIVKGSGALGKIGGVIIAGISIPVNAALVASAYNLRLSSAMENAGVVGKAKDSAWSWLKKK